MTQYSSLRRLNFGNVTMFKSQKFQLFNSQIGSLALNRRKWSEMGPEWSPDPENRSPGFSRPFSRLWDRSRGPKPPKYSPNSRSTAPPGGRYVMVEQENPMARHLHLAVHAGPDAFVFISKIPHFAQLGCPCPQALQWKRI